MANTTHTVNPGGGADYTSLAAYEDAIDGTAYGAGETATVNCAGSTADLTYLRIAGWDPDVKIYIIGNLVMTQSTPLRIDLTKYHFGDATTDYVNLQNNNTNYVTFSNIQFISGGANCYHGFGQSDSTGVVVKNCIFKGNSAGGSGLNSGNGTEIDVFNNVFYDFTNSTVVDFTDYPHLSHFYNNTIYNCSVGIAVLNGDTTNVHIKNNAITATTCYSGTFNADAAGNISSDNSSPNSALRSLTPTYVSTTGGSEDFHLGASDTAAKDAGTSSVDSVLTDDIDGVTRTGAWDIGADEYVAAGSSSSSSKRRRIIMVQ